MYSLYIVISIYVILTNSKVVIGQGGAQVSPAILNIFFLIFSYLLKRTNAGLKLIDICTL